MLNFNWLIPDNVAMSKFESHFYLLEEVESRKDLFKKHWLHSKTCKWGINTLHGTFMVLVKGFIDKDNHSIVLLSLNQKGSFFFFLSFFHETFYVTTDFFKINWKIKCKIFFSYRNLSLQVTLFHSKHNYNKYIK